MEDSIRDFIYEDNIIDRKLKDFVEKCEPEGVNIARISSLTYAKIHHAKRKRRILLLSATAAMLLLVVGSIFISFYNMDLKAKMVAQTPVSEMMTLKVGTGDKMTIMLSDGTKIIANSRSEIRYPKVFSGDTREVYALGEVYFEVAHDDSKPFIVNTDKLKVKVLGTHFCINTHGDNSTDVILLEGCITATSDINDSVTMRPNQLLRVKDGMFESLQNVDGHDYISWIDGYLNLHGDNLPAVVQRVNDYYGTNYTVENTNSSKRLYGKLLYQKDVRDVIKIIEKLNY